MIYFFISIVEILIIFILQSTVFAGLKLANVVPDLIMVLVIAKGYMKGQYFAMFVGFTAGMLMDLFFSSNIGFCALLYVFVGFLAGYSKKIYRETDFLTPIALAGAGEAVYSVLYYIFRFMLRGKFDFTFYFGQIILPRIIYTLLGAVIFYPAIWGVNRLIEKKFIKTKDVREV